MSEYDKLKLDNQLCFSLYALSREVIKMYQPVLSKYNLTYTQYVTMLAMWELEKAPFKEVAKKLYLDSGTLTPVLKKLESMGLVNKYRDKNDDRMVIVELTQKAIDLKDDIKMTKMDQSLITTPFCSITFAYRAFSLVEMMQ